jgi:RNA polymerase sigma-70 factor (ECF subfamily)
VVERREFAAFCEAEWPRLVGALYLSTGDRALAEDLAQETLLRAFANWRRVSRLDAPGGWVHRVSLNLLRSHRSAWARRRTGETGARGSGCSSEGT